jgi:glycosyltransferase involved in cell wall biosynthesis
MRVVLLSRNACVGDAIGRQLLAMLRYFRQTGAEVRVFLSEERHILPEIKSAHPVILPAQQIWADPELRHDLTSANLVLAEFGSSYDLMDLLPAVAQAGPRIIVDYQGLTPFELADPALYPDLETAHNQRKLLWCAHAVLVHSRFAEEELRAAIGIPAERTHRMPCCVDIKPKLLTREGRNVLRQGLSRDDIHIVLFLGRFAKNKQPEIILRALANLPTQKPVHVVYLGDQGDVYAENYQRCRELGQQLGLERRVHFLGKVDDAGVSAWYQAADVLVLPSLHECFGMPPVEAIAHGLPVICADRGALPETLGHAGLTFSGGDSKDLAEQLRRVLEPQVVAARDRRIAIVTHRFGTTFAGGAEISLRRMAQAWQSRGWSVEVFSTCNQDASQWQNSLPAGTKNEDGFLVHRFPIDAYDSHRLAAAYEAINRQDKPLKELQEEYLANSLGSEALLKELQRRREGFSAIVTGPYLFKLTYEVAKQFSSQVLLAPCFHDERLAYLPAFRETYSRVGGMLFHSPMEAHFAAERLAINHPRNTVIGTVLPDSAFQAETRRSDSSPYLVYCGRYCPEKGLSELIDWMRTFQERHPNKLRLVCMGQGPTKLPNHPWLSDLGFVSEAEKRQVLANAFALVNLSSNESLSIVVLEAWALGTPAIVSGRCPVLCDQIKSAQAGAIVRSENDFEGVLKDWLQEEGQRKKLGQEGLRFVKTHYASLDNYADRLEEIVRSLQKPLSTLARRQGLERAQEFSARAWESRLSQILDDVQLRYTARDEIQIKIVPLHDQVQIPVSQGSVALAVRLVNAGAVVVPNEGPAQITLVAEVRNNTGARISSRRARASLPEALIPGQTTPSIITVALPRRVGRYRIRLSIVSRYERSRRVICRHFIPLRMTKRMSMPTNKDQPLAPLFQSARQMLAQAHRLDRLPEDYVDVTEGKFANAKRLIKRKLLGNFRRAYVDVAFRQQSALNQKILAVMNVLLETSSMQSGTMITGLQEQVRRLQRQNRRERARSKRLERRLDALNASTISG